MKAPRLDDLLRPGGDPPVPLDLLPRILALPERHSRRRRGRVAAVAAAVLLAASLWAVWSGSGKRPGGTEAVPPPPPSVRALVTAALSSPPDGRLVRDLGARALPSLHRAALGGDAAAARTALDWIGRLARPRSLPILAKAAALPDREIAAARALTALGPRALPALTPLLSRPATAGVALEAVCRIGDHRALVAVCAGIAAARDSRVRRRLVDALAGMDGVRGARRLLALLGDPAAGADALAALFRHGKRLRPALERLARGREEAVARKAVNALALLADPSSVPVLTELLGNRRRRVLAARALARIGDGAAADALVTVAADPQVREACRLGGRALEARLLDRLAGAHAAIRPDLIRLIGVVGSDRSVPALLGLAAGPATAPPAVSALGRIGTLRALRGLVSLSENSYLRRLALRALCTSRTAAARQALTLIEEKGARPRRIVAGTPRHVSLM